MPAVAVCALVPPARDLAATLRSDSLRVADPTDLRGVLDALPDNSEYVVLVGEQFNEAAVRRASAVLEDAGCRVAVVLLPHGPAAVVLLAREVARSGADAAQGPTLVAALAADTWSGAWLPRLARLDDPAPSFGQYLRSLLPGGAGYVVTLGGGRRGILSAKKVHTSTGLSHPVAGATPGELSDGARDALCQASGSQELASIDWLTVDTAERFGHPRAVEVAALPSDAKTTLGRLRPEAEACRACGMHRYSTICPYCRVRPAPLETVPGGSL